MHLGDQLSYLFLLALSFCGWQKSLDSAALQALYVQQLTPHERSERVIQIGHSLVNRDMPMMLEQMAAKGHNHRSQLGWGAPLKSHWDYRYQEALQAVSSASFDALGPTEMAKIKDAIKHIDSPEYLRRWAREARIYRADVRFYLYETWHPPYSPEGWLLRLDKVELTHFRGRVLV